MISINIFIEIDDEQEWWWWSTCSSFCFIYERKQYNIKIWFDTQYREDIMIIFMRKMTVSCKWISSYQKQKQKLLTSQIELKSVVNIQAQYFRSP